MLSLGEGKVDASVDEVSANSRLPGTPVYHMDPYRVKQKVSCLFLIELLLIFNN